MYLGESLYDFAQPVNGNLVLRAKWKYIITQSELSDEEKVPKEDLPESGIVPEGLWIAGVEDQVYTGKALRPEVRVYDGSRKLTEKTDYTLSYKNNTKANDASDPKKAPAVTVKGKGNYTGSVAATFKIKPVDLNEEKIMISMAALAYNKKVQQKAPTLTFNGKKMSAKRDYTVNYPASESGAYQETGRYPVQVTGVGNFTGTKTVYLEITDKTLIGKAKSVKIPNQTYNGGEAVTIPQSALILYMKSKNKPLVEGIDYTVAYENNCEVGTAAVIVSGIGDYAGTKRLSFKITGTTIKKAAVEGITNKVYNGTEQQQNIIVRLDNRELVPDKDYKVTYSKNVNVGTASLAIQGIGAYSGTVKKTFKITAYDLGVDEKGLIGSLEINGKTESEADTEKGLSAAYMQGGCQPKVTLRFGEIELVKGKDYTVTYQNNKKIANASAKKAPTIIIKGKGNFKGMMSEKFTIVKKNLADVKAPVLMYVADTAFKKGAGKYISRPVLTDTNGRTLKAGTDYDTSYMSSDGITELTKKSTVEDGAYVCVTVRGKGKYEGSLMTTYRITQADFTKASVKIAPQIYTGSSVYLNGQNKEDVLVRVGKAELINGVDYEIMEDSYINNIKKGTASVKIRGINNYGGTKTVKFKIRAKKMESFSSIVRGVFIK